MAPVSRRSVPRGLLATSVGSAAASALRGCGALTGFATTGGSGMTFFSTQFAPVEEAERFRGTLRTQVDASPVRASPVGGQHGDRASPVDGYPTDLTNLLDGLGDLGWPAAPGSSRVAPTQIHWYDPETQLLLEVR